MRVGAALCVTLLLGCEGKRPRLELSEHMTPGVTNEAAEYRDGSTHVVSWVAHFYNAPTGERSDVGDFAPVFRAITGKEPAEPAALRSGAALLAELKKAGVKLKAEPEVRPADSPMGRKVRAFTVGR